MKKPKGARNERALTSAQSQKAQHHLYARDRGTGDIVNYKPDWMVDMGQFEFRSPHKPRRRIPVSETGYRSHFARIEDVEAYDSPRDYARDFVLDQLRSRLQARREDHDKLPLF